MNENKFSNPTGRPKLSFEDAIKVVEEHFGIKEFDSSVCKYFDSYDDQNIFLRADDGKEFVLKVYNSVRNGNTEETLDFQNQVIQRLASNGLVCPEPVAASNGKYTVQLNADNPDLDESERFLCRLLTFVQGVTYASVFHKYLDDPGNNPLDVPSTLTSIGEYLAQLDQALMGFTHPSEQKDEFDWDMRNCEKVVLRLRGHLSDEKAKIIDLYYQRYLRIKDKLNDESNIRWSVIHGDCNDHNIIVGDDGKIIAALDFGDTMKTQLVNDLAVCIGYMMLDQKDPLDAAVSVAWGYFQHLELNQEELDVLFTLSCMRIVVSVLFSNYSFQQEPDNEYLLVTAKPGWQLLETLQGLYSKEEFVAGAVDTEFLRRLKLKQLQ